MRPYFFLLLFLLPTVLGCERAVAIPGHSLSVPRSLMGNADVALLKSYLAQDVNTCIQECCTEKYGSCTVVSFQKNGTEGRCQHFNCRPLNKCEYVSSNSTDSFSFSSSPIAATVPYNNNSSKLIPTSPGKSTPENAKIEQHDVAKANDIPSTDDLSMKSRKGVFEESSNKSSVKARKGVILEGSKSNIKPRKGVEPFTKSNNSSDSYFYHTSKPDSSASIVATIATDDELALQHIFEDDIQPTQTHELGTQSTTLHKDVMSPMVHIPPSASSYTVQPLSTLCRHSDIQSSFYTRSLKIAASTSLQTPLLQTTHLLHTQGIEPSVTVIESTRSVVAPTIFDHSRIIFGPNKADRIEAREQKYKSSMHLVLSLVFGLVVLFAVLGVVAKRMYDRWVYRHYRRMDFLIEGMYNGS